MDCLGTPRRRTARAFVSAAVIATLLTASAQAEVLLANVEGAVSINHGDGFKPASIGSALAPGDRVRTAKGSADIVYDNGCSAKVGPHQVAVVLSDPPPCTKVGGLKDGVVAAPAEFGVEPIFAGGLLLGGGVGLAALIASNYGNTYNNPIVKPVSP